MKQRFIKYMPDSEMAKYLQTKPIANHLANIIATRARRIECPYTGLKVGQCYLGDCKKIGITPKQYRTAKILLKKIGYSSFLGTNKGTTATLVSIDVYDININMKGEPRDEPQGEPRGNQGANKGRQTKKEKKDNNDKELKNKDIGTLPFLNEVTEILKFFISETGKSLKLTKIGRSDKYKIIMPKLKGGSTVEECKAVISLKSKQWKNDKQMSKHLCIPTLFRASNFEKYIDELGGSKEAPKKFTYPLPDFLDAEDRQSFFYVRFNSYKPHLDIQKVNTIYKKRALYEKDAEGLCFELELKFPKLAEMQIQYNRLT